MPMNMLLAVSYLPLAISCWLLAWFSSLGATDYNISLLTHYTITVVREK